MSNIVIAIAFMISTGWAWGSVSVMQGNYQLQQELDAKTQEEILVGLEVANAQLEQRYYQSEEYIELAVREKLGMAYPGEKMLILPPNTQKAKDADRVAGVREVTVDVPEGNLQQWINFLFGGNRSSLQD